MNVRQAASGDTEAIVNIAQACFGMSAWGAAHFAPHPARSIFVADSDGSGCVGYSVLQRAGGEAELQAIAVLPDFRRQGIGEALLRQALREAQADGADEVYLEVRESNRAAQGFYRRFGFVTCGTRPGYYRLPEEAAVVMRRQL